MKNLKRRIGYTAWRYVAVREEKEDSSLGHNLTYGIQAKRKTQTGWEQIELIHAVTSDRGFAEKIAVMFTLHQLSPIHLRDVLEDMLS